MDDQEPQATDPVDIKRLRELAAALSGKGIDTLEDLRLAICRDFETGIKTVTDRTKTSRALLVALFITEARDDAGKKGKRRLVLYWSGFKGFRSVFSFSKTEIRDLLKTKGVRHWREAREPIAILVARPTRLLTNWRTHWPDALVILLPLMLVALLIFRLNSIDKNSLRYVTTTTAIPAFHKISDGVEIKRSPSAKSAFTNIADVRDRYVLTSLPAGTTLQDNQLLSAPLSGKMQGRKIMSVPIKAGNYIPTLTAPAEATLVFSPRTWDSKTTSPGKFEVIVLRIEGSGETRSAVVALPGDKFDEAALLLGSHEAFLTGLIQ